MKKASIVVSTIIIIVIIAGTLLIAGTASSTIFAGISLLWLSQDPCKSLTQLSEKTELACQYGYTVRADIKVPSKIDDFVIIRLPNDTRKELTGFNPAINTDYDECRGGACLCLANREVNPLGNVSYLAPARGACSFCYAIAKQTEPPAFCCDYGYCKFEDISNIPDVNEKIVDVTITQRSRIFEGLHFIIENKTDNITWLEEFCNQEIYDTVAAEGVYILDYNDTVHQAHSGCCFRIDRIVGSCITEEIQAKNNADRLRDLVDLTQGTWPLNGTVALEISPQATGGVELKKVKFIIWWKVAG